MDTIHWKGGGQFIENQNFAVITIDTFYQSIYLISLASGFYIQTKIY